MLQDSTMFSGICRFSTKQTKKRYTELFKSVKVALTPRSLAVLEVISLQRDIASKINRVLIGTETLDQYETSLNNLQWDHEAGQECKRQFEAVVEKETRARDLMLEALKHCLLRLPKLKDVTIEDRPVETPSCEEYRNFVGSIHISRLTGLKFS
jgi:hypothetical protein